MKTYAVITEQGALYSYYNTEQGAIKALEKLSAGAYVAISYINPMMTD